MALSQTLLDGTEAALRRRDSECARMLLALAVRVATGAEASRVRMYLDGLPLPVHTFGLAPILAVWQKLTPAQLFEANAGRLLGRIFAFEDAQATAKPAAAATAVPSSGSASTLTPGITTASAPDDTDSQLASLTSSGLEHEILKPMRTLASPGGAVPRQPTGESLMKAAPYLQPYPQWAKPTDAEVSTVLTGSFFHNDVQEARKAFESGDGLLLKHARGASSCDLLAALVQLLLSAPFSPDGFCADMLVGLLGGFYVATTPSEERTQPPAPLQWSAVSALDESRVRRAIRDGLADDFFYEASSRATRAWRYTRASRIHKLLQCLNERHGGASLQWIKSLSTPDALRALLRLPGVSLHSAASLLLFELRRPLMPVCTNALEEAKAMGWVPPFAGKIHAPAAKASLRARNRPAARLASRARCTTPKGPTRLTSQLRVVVGSGLALLSSLPVSVFGRARDCILAPQRAVAG
jgi:hypothetical protein